MYAEDFLGLRRTKVCWVEVVLAMFPILVVVVPILAFWLGGVLA